MKQFYLLTKTLLVAVCLLGGANSAWADETAFEKDAVIGSETEPGGWWYATSNVIDIPKNKTLILKFKTYSATDSQLAGKGANGADLAWGSYMSHLLRIGYQKSSANNDIYDLRWRADGYGWVEGNGTTGDQTAPSWLVYNGSNTRWGTDGAEFREDITGSTVTMTIQRFGTELRIAQDIAATSGNYRKYFVMNTEYEGFMWAQIVLERAYVKVLEDATTVDSEDALTGTLIGKLNRTGRLADHGAKVDFTLAPEKSLNLKFKSYNNHIATWGTWLVELQHGGDYYDVVSGSKGNSWGTLKVAESVSTSGYPATDAAILDAFEGATVDLTVSRSGATVNISAKITPISGDEMTLTSSITPEKEGFATSDITVRPLVELGYIDLLSVSATIGSTGWTTFASPCALDLSKMTASEGDVKAYYASAIGGGKVTMTSTESTGVAAGEGLMLKGTAGATITIPVAASGSAIDGNMLKGCITSTPLAVDATSGYNNYVLVNNGGIAEFQSLAENGATIPAGKAYLQNGAYVSSGARLSIVFDDATAIKDVDASAKSGAQADGKYLEKGKIVIVKNGTKFNANGQRMK